MREKGVSGGLAIWQAAQAYHENTSDIAAELRARRTEKEHKAKVAEARSLFGC